MHEWLHKPRQHGISTSPILTAIDPSHLLKELTCCQVNCSVPSNTSFLSKSIKNSIQEAAEPVVGRVSGVFPKYKLVKSIS